MVPCQEIRQEASFPLPLSIQGVVVAAPLALTRGDGKGDVDGDGNAEGEGKSEGEGNGEGKGEGEGSGSPTRLPLRGTNGLRSDRRVEGIGGGATGLAY